VRSAARRYRRPRRAPFERLRTLLARRGLPDEPWRNPREVAAAARRARPDLPVGALEALVAERLR
jgi:hypothetical protein